MTLKKKLSIAMLIVLTILIGMFLMACDDKSSQDNTQDEENNEKPVDPGDNGDENNRPQKVAIEISSFDDLLSMADRFDSIKDNRFDSIKDNEYFLLTTDIDCDEQSWKAVGSLDNPFSCEFDGNGYTISNLVLATEDSRASFWGVAKDSYIHDVTFSNITISVEDYSEEGLNVGLIAQGYNELQLENITLINSNITINTNNLKNFGGIIAEDHSTGLRKNLTVKDSSFNISTMAGSNNIGLITGYSTNLVIEDCKIENITGSVLYMGNEGLSFGLISGKLETNEAELSQASITNCTYNMIYAGILSLSMTTENINVGTNIGYVDENAVVETENISSTETQILFNGSAI